MAKAWTVFAVTLFFLLNEFQWKAAHEASPRRDVPSSVVSGWPHESTIGVRSAVTVNSSLVSNNRKRVSFGSIRHRASFSLFHRGMIRWGNPKLKHASNLHPLYTFIFYTVMEISTVLLSSMSTRRSSWNVSLSSFHGSFFSKKEIDR